MKGLATLLLLLIVFGAGIYVGGSLGVLGKPNDVYLQTDYTYGVLPYFHQGDRVHFFDPNQFANGQFAAAPDVSIVSPTNPCKALDSNGICEITVPSGTYKYGCHYCGDPTIPVGTNGPVHGGWSGDDGGQASNRSIGSVPGSSVAAFFTLKVKDPASHAGALGTVYAYNSLYARIARAFVAAFFTPAIPPGKPVEPHHPLTPPVNSGTVQAFIDCGSDHKITVESPGLWFPPTTMPILLGSKLTWTRQTGLASNPPGKPPFIVQDLVGSTEFATACGAAIAANNAGTTMTACTLAGPATRHLVKYTITDPTGVCSAPPEGFNVEVAPAPVAVSSDPGTGLPGIR
jgi:hypothetical protein